MGGDLVFIGEGMGGVVQVTLSFDLAGRVGLVLHQLLVLPDPLLPLFLFDSYLVGIFSFQRLHVVRGEESLLLSLAVHVVEVIHYKSVPPACRTATLNFNKVILLEAYVRSGYFLDWERRRVFFFSFFLVF